MSNIRYRSTYYNTTGTSVQWKIEICDTEPVSQVIKFESYKPVFDYEGLTNELTSGIFPSMFKFGMYIRESPQLIDGQTFGPHHSFIQDLFESDEGRFRVKLYRDGQLYFVGVIMPDECSYEDDASPYLMNITAVDGLYRLRSEDYVSEVGQLEYTTPRVDGLGTSEFSSTPVLVIITGSEWVLIEHISEIQHNIIEDITTSYRASTYARYEQYATESPGTGWVDQGGNLWALSPTYTNETIVNEAELYHLTRDIDSTPFRRVSEYFARAIGIISIIDEYPAGSTAYDVVNVWYDTTMLNLEGDPTTQIRLNESKFATGQKWWEVIETLLKHFYMRLYYAAGRYHFEQISERGTTTITRWCYDKDGTYITNTPVNLDLSFSGNNMGVEARGKFKVLAALRSAKIKIEFPSDNLLEGKIWSLHFQGSRYLARIRTTQEDTRFLISVPVACIATFLDLPPTLPESFTLMKVNTHIQVRIVNVTSATNYYLTPASQDNFTAPTWGTDEATGYFSRDTNLDQTIAPLVQRRGLFTFNVLTDELPGNAGDSFDVFFSVSFSWAFHLANAHAHFLDNPDQLFLEVSTSGQKMTTVDVDHEPVDSPKERAFECVNSLDNTVVVEVAAKFSDDGILGNAIEIQAATPPAEWVRSSRLWNRHGETTGAVELLQLLAREMVAVRTVPLRVYTGAFITSLLSTQNRINRNSIIMLPLSFSFDTGTDTASGEFVNLERAEPPDTTITNIPFDAGEPIIIGGPSGTGGTDPALVLETNEVITGGGGALTELDIVNTMGATIAAGEVVRITHPTTGDYETVTLTEDILPDSVLMEFVSHAFVLDFPDASPITIQVVAHPPGFPGLPWNIDKRGWTDDISIKFPTYYNFPDPEENSAVIINDRIKIYRDGVEMVYVPGAASATPAQNRVHLWDIDYADRVATFPIPFNDERLTIRAR